MTPDKFTIDTFMHWTPDGHNLWVHDWGNKDSENPMIFLHGGPGGNVSNHSKISFDPKKHRVIFFDQRGCGQSEPKGKLESNDTWKLVDDITAIADRLKLGKFTLTGGSWGSCLALIYAIKNPKRVSALVLMGIFTGTKKETDWVNLGGWRDFFPEAWEKFVDSTPLKHRSEPADYHIKRIIGDNLEKSAESGRALSDMELSIMSLDDRYTPFEAATYDPTHARMEMHYVTNNLFLEDDYVMKNADKLTMPIWLVQGRYDFICPPITAWNLHKKLPNSKLTFTMANHDFDRPTYEVYRTILANLEV